MKTKTTFRLSRVDPCHPETLTGLRAGDVLVALNGQVIEGDEASVREKVSEGPCISTWLRDGTVFSLRVGPMLPGPIEPDSDLSDAIDLPDQFPQDLKSYSNWMIFRTEDGRVEILCQDRPLLALVLPILWLAHVRMWTWAAILALTMTMALPAGPWVVVVVWMAFSIHLWQTGGLRLMMDRLAAGCKIEGRLTCKSVSDAHSLWLALHPGTRFVFGGAAQSTEHNAFG